MGKYYEITIPSLHAKGDTRAFYFSSEESAVEQGLVYVISSLEKQKQKLLNTQSIEDIWETQIYNYIIGYYQNENDSVEMIDSQLRFDKCPGAISIKVESPMLVRLRELAREREEPNEEIKRLLESYEVFSNGVFCTNLRSVVDCLDQAIKFFNSVLSNIFLQPEISFEKKFQKYVSSNFTFSSGPLVYYAGHSLNTMFLIKEVEMFIDEIITP